MTATLVAFIAPKQLGGVLAKMRYVLKMVGP